MSGQKVTFSAVWAIVRDVVCLGLGTWGVIHEEVTGRASPPLLILYGSLLASPGAIAAIQLWVGKVSTPSIPVQPSPSPPVPSSPEVSGKP